MVMKYELYMNIGSYTKLNTDLLARDIHKSYTKKKLFTGSDCIIGNRITYFSFIDIHATGTV